MVCRWTWRKSRPTLWHDNFRRAVMDYLFAASAASFSSWLTWSKCWEAETLFLGFCAGAIAPVSNSNPSTCRVKYFWPQPPASCSLAIRRAGSPRGRLSARITGG